MNKTDAEFLRSKLRLKAAEAHLVDLRLEDLSLVERIETDAMLEDGVVTSREIYEGLGLEDEPRW